MSRKNPILPGDEQAVRLPRDRGGFVGHVATLMTGNGVSQAISVLGTLLLARLFAPEAFGLFALFVTVVSLMGVLGGGRYELGIMLPEKDDEAANVMALATLVLAGIAGVAALLINAYGFTIAYMLGDVRLSPWMWWVPIALFVNGFYQVLAHWCARMKRFRRLAISRVLCTFSIVTAQLALLPVYPRGGAALVAGWIVGECLGTAVLLAQVARYEGRFLARAYDWTTVRESVAKYKNFPLYKAPYSFLANASNQFVIVILRVFSDLHTVGLFSIAHRAIRAPITLITSSMNQVFYEKAATELKNGGLEQFVTRLLRLQAALAVPVLVFLGFEAPLIFETFLGPQWAGAGVYAALLSFAGFFYFLTAWLDRLIDVCGRQRLSLMLKMASNATALGGLTFTLWYSGNTRLAVGVFTASEMFYTGIWLVIAYRVASFDVSRLRLVVREALVSAAVALAVLSAIQTLFGGLWALGMSAIAVLLLEAGWLVLLAPLWSSGTTFAKGRRGTRIVLELRKSWVEFYRRRSKAKGEQRSASITAHEGPAETTPRRGQPAALPGLPGAAGYATRSHTEPGSQSAESTACR